MPTYEYTCKTCGENFDIVQSFSDKPLRKHPGDCGGPVQKVFHASGIVFKGSGFYATDSRGTSSVKTAADTSSSNGTAPKPETTPSTTSPTKSESTD